MFPEAAILMHFSISLVYTYSEIFRKITSDGVQLLVNLLVMLSNFEPLLRRFKYFITALINAEQLLLYNSSTSLCSENLGKILIRNNQQTTCWHATTLLRTSMQSFPWKFCGTSKTIFTTISVANLQITVKSNQSVGKKYTAGCLIF